MNLFLFRRSVANQGDGAGGEWIESLPSYKPYLDGERQPTLQVT